MSNAGTGSTYRDVHRQVCSNVRSIVRNQNPQLETSSAADLDEAFLGGAVDPLPGSFVLTHEAGGWVLDGGSVHGLSGPIGEDSTTLDVQVPGEDQRVAGIRITSVTAGEAQVAITDGQLDEGTAYRALVVSTPLPRLSFSVMGDQAKADELRTVLATRDQSGPRFVVELVDDGEPADVGVRAGEQSYLLRETESESPLCPTADSAESAVHTLEHIAAWMRVRDLGNPSTRLSADAVGVTVAPATELGAAEPWEVDGRYRFTYDTDGAEPRPRAYVVTLTNRTARSLWVSLVDLTDIYGIYVDAIAEGAVELAGGESTEVPLNAVVPDEQWEQGVTEVTDVLKLLVSTEQFDARTLSQTTSTWPRTPRREQFASRCPPSTSCSHGWSPGGPSHRGPATGRRTGSPATSW